MAIRAAVLKAVIGADDSGFRTAMAESDKRLGSFAASADRKLKEVGRGFERAGRAATIGLSVPFAAAAVSALKQAGQFERSLDVLQATSSATGEQMRQIGSAARALGADLSLPGTSASDAATAMLEMSKANFSVMQSMDAAKGVLQLSAAAQIGNARAAEITANALNMFRLSGDKAVMVADLLAGSANASSGSIEQMADALQQSGALADSAGIPIDTLVASIAQLANAGIKGSDAGTSLKQMIMSLQNPSEKALKAFDDLKISIYDAGGKMKPFKQIIADFAEATGKLTQKERDHKLATIFGSDAVRAASILIRDGAKAHDEMREKVSQQGSAAKLAGAQNKGLLGAIDGLRSSVDTFLTGEGSKYSTWLADQIRGLSGFVGSLDDGKEGLRDFGLKAATAAALAGPLLIVIGKTIEAFQTLKGLSAVKGLIAGFGTEAALSAVKVGALEGAFMRLAMAIKGLGLLKIGGILGGAYLAYEGIKAVVDGAGPIKGGPNGQSPMGWQPPGASSGVKAPSHSGRPIGYDPQTKSYREIVVLPPRPNHLIEDLANPRKGFGATFAGGSGGKSIMQIAGGKLVDRKVAPPAPPPPPSKDNHGGGGNGGGGGGGSQGKSAAQEQAEKLSAALQQLRNELTLAKAPSAENRVAIDVLGTSYASLSAKAKESIAPLVAMRKALDRDATDKRKKDAADSFRESIAESVRGYRDQILLAKDASIENEVAVKRYHAAYQTLNDDQKKTIALEIEKAKQAAWVEGAAKAEKRYADAVADMRRELSLAKDQTDENRASWELYGKAATSATADELARIRELAGGYRDLANTKALSANFEKGKGLIARDDELTGTPADLKSEKSKDQVRIEESARRTAEYVRELQVQMLGFGAATREARIEALMLDEALTRADAAKVVDLQAQAERMREWADLVKQATDDVVGFIGDAFGSLFSDGIQGFFENVVKGFDKMLFDIAKSYLNSWLKKIVEGWIGDLAGAAIGGKAPTEGSSQGLQDSMTNQIRTPQVVVPRSGGMALAGSAAGGGGVTVTMVVNTPDAGSFRRSMGQIMEDAHRAGESVRRRNGT